MNQEIERVEEVNQEVQGGGEGDGGGVEMQEGSGEVTERLVPVGEAIRYRKRAQAAEGQLQSLKDQIEATKRQLEEARETIEQLDRRVQIDRVLAEAEATDLEVARLLTEAAVEGMSEPDVKLAVEDLRRHKPYLFRRSETAGRGGGVMSARVRRDGVVPAAEAAAKAAASGDRRDLLKYLRLRRPGKG